MQFLQEGIEDFLRALRRLPRQVRNLSVAYHLEAKMKAFKDSIPLLLDLKHEALRDRCVSSTLSAKDVEVWEGTPLLKWSLLRSDCQGQGLGSEAGLEVGESYFYVIVSV